MIQAKNCYLRALEPDDFDFLYEVENEEALWHVGELKQPISLHTIQAYLENAHQPIEEAKQVRFAICDLENNFLGMIDLFEYDAKNQRAGVGVVILEKHRNKHFAQNAIIRLKQYAKEHLLLHQLSCEVQESNTKSVAIFQKCGFKITGTLADWQRTKTGFENIHLMQCVL